MLYNMSYATLTLWFPFIALKSHCLKHSSPEYQSRLALLRNPKNPVADANDRQGAEVARSSLTSTPVKGEDEEMFKEP